MVKNIILILIILPSVLLAEKVLVQQIEPVGIEKEKSAVIEEALVLEIGNRKGYSVSSTQELNDLLKYLKIKKSLRLSDSKEGMKKVREKLKTDILITGKLAKLADELILSLNAIDMNSAEIKKRITVQGMNIKEVKKQLSRAVDILLGKTEVKSKFVLPKDETFKLAVMPLKPSGVDKSASDTLSQILNSQLNQIDGIKVISQDDLKAIIEKTRTDITFKCENSIQCLTDIGASFGASLLVTGSVGKIKDMYVITVKLIDVREGEILSRIVESFEGKENQLKHAIKLIALNLVGAEYEASKGRVDFTFNAENAEVSFAGKSRKTDDGTYKKDGIVPGRYLLKVISEDFYPLQSDIYVAPDSLNTVYFELKEKPAEWYETWWFWTITGVMVAGTTATTAYLLNQDKYAGGEIKNPE